METHPRHIIATLWDGNTEMSKLAACLRGRSGQAAHISTVGATSEKQQSNDTFGETDTEALAP